MNLFRRIVIWLQQPEKASGPLTVGAMIAAFLMVNSSFRPIYQLVHHTPVAIRFGSLMMEKPLILWINEGLMVFFFLLVALEIKREIMDGHLDTAARVALPAIAALGGMLIPALTYLMFTWGDTAAVRGWAIPSATDTVLAIAALNVLGTKVPPAVRTFLLALAIFDDMGAIVILAAVFTDSLSLVSLIVSGGGAARVDSSQPNWRYAHIGLRGSRPRVVVRFAPIRCSRHRGWIPDRTDRPPEDERTQALTPSCSRAGPSPLGGAGDRTRICLFQLRRWLV